MRARPCGAPSADLVLVETVPAVEVGPARCRARASSAGIALLGRDRRLPPDRLVVDDVADGLHRVGLGVADEADRAALDPAGGVDAGARWSFESLSQHLALVVRDHAVAACRTGRRAAASRSSRPRGRRPGSGSSRISPVPTTPPSPSGAVRSQRNAATPAVVVVDDLERLRVEVQVQATGCLRPALLTEGAGATGCSTWSITMTCLLLAIAGARRVVVVEVLVVDDHVDVAQLAELAQLERA